MDIPVEAFVAVSDEHKLEASTPDPDALAEIFLKVQDALDQNDDGPIDTTSPFTIACSWGHREIGSRITILRDESRPR